MTDLIVETEDVELDVDGVAVIGGASYTAGTGIDITNNVISVDDTVAMKSDLSSVATSGSYNDLTNKPTIPTKTSQLENNSGFITKDVDDLTNYRTSSAQDVIDSNKQPLITSSNKLSSDLVSDTDHTNKFVSATDISNWNAKAEVSQIPTNVSQLNNDSGYLTLGTLPIYNGGVQ